MGLDVGHPVGDWTPRRWLIHGFINLSDIQIIYIYYEQIYFAGWIRHYCVVEAFKEITTHVVPKETSIQDFPKIMKSASKFLEILKLFLFTFSN